MTNLLSIDNANGPALDQDENFEPSSDAMIQGGDKTNLTWRDSEWWDTGVYPGTENMISTYSWVDAGALQSMQVDKLIETRQKQLGIRDLLDAVSLINTGSDAQLALSTGMFYNNAASGTPWVGTATGVIALIQQEAHRVLGVRYSHDGRFGPNAFDCSGLTFHLLNRIGGLTNIKQDESTAADLWKMAKFNLVLQGPILCGDTFFTFHNSERYDNCGHVGVFIGNDMVVETRGNPKGVEINPWSNFPHKDSTMKWARIPGVETITQRSPGTAAQSSGV